MATLLSGQVLLKCSELGVVQFSITVTVGEHKAAVLRNRIYFIIGQVAIAVSTQLLTGQPWLPDCSHQRVRR